MRTPGFGRSPYPTNTFLRIFSSPLLGVLLRAAYVTSKAYARFLLPSTAVEYHYSPTFREE